MIRGFCCLQRLATGAGPIQQTVTFRVRVQRPYSVIYRLCWGMFFPLVSALKPQHLASIANGL